MHAFQLVGFNSTSKKNKKISCFISFTVCFCKCLSFEKRGFFLKICTQFSIVLLKSAPFCLWRVLINFVSDFFFQNMFCQ